MMHFGACRTQLVKDLINARHKKSRPPEGRRLFSKLNAFKLLRHIPDM